MTGGWEEALGTVSVSYQSGLGGVGSEGAVCGGVRGTV